MVEETRLVEKRGRKPIVYTLGRDVKIEIWGGYNTIGGNCIVVRDRDDVIILDQGLNFKNFSQYYGGYIQPEIIDDLLEINAIPPREIYEDATEIHISHLHLDHLGSLALPYECEAKVYVPSRHVLEKLMGFWYWSWKELLLPSELYELLDYVNTTAKSEKVTEIPVSHSAHPAYSFIVETSEGTILYTGDLRLKSPAQLIDTIKNYQEALEGRNIDVLISEGTNFSRRITPLYGEDIEQMLLRVLDKYKRNILFVAAHPLDIESTLLVTRILKLKGYDPVFTHTRYAELLDVQLEEINNEEIKYYLLYLKGPKPTAFKRIKEVKYRDIKDWKIAFFTSVSAISELKILKRRGIELEGTLQMTLIGEPLEEEGRIMEARLGNWIKHFGMNSIRLHLSGHYHPHEFEDIIRAVKPKKLIPIHTKAPKTMLTLFEKHKKTKSTRLVHKIFWVWCF